MEDVLTTCVFCGCGCALYLRTENNRVIGAVPSLHHPVSQNNLCAKGWHLHDFIHDSRRLTSPLIRKKGKLCQASWEEALKYTAARLGSILDEHGGKALGVLASTKCTNEENYLIQKLARAVLKTNNIDHCARLKHAQSLTGLATTFGSGAMTNSMNEIENAKAILVSGSNTVKTHPQLARRIFKAVRQGARLVVIDPRRSPLAEHADVHLDLRPGTDIMLINGLMKVILDENLADDTFIQMRTENFIALRDLLYRLDLREVEEITGVVIEKIEKAARLYAMAYNAVICYCQGITQHICGLANVHAIANLAMLTGNVEKENTGVHPFRGQNNVQGACDMGILPTFFSGYQPLADPRVHGTFEKAWKTNLPTAPGLDLQQMSLGSSVKGMLIFGANPVLSDQTFGVVCNDLHNIEFVAVSELFLTETTEIADVVFPAASFAEKDGTFTNTERRVQRVRQAISPLGGCRSDLDIIIALSGKMDYRMTYDNAAEVMEEVALLNPIYGGIYYDRLDPWGLQWPCWNRSHPGSKFLHRRNFTKNKVHFVPTPYQPLSLNKEKDFPFTLLTGRKYHQYNTGSMSRKSYLLNRECQEAILEIHPKDAEQYGIATGDSVTLSSRWGSIDITAKVTKAVNRGTVFTPIHFSEVPVKFITINPDHPNAELEEHHVSITKIG